jgi:nucleolar complex protein 2
LVEEAAFLLTEWLASEPVHSSIGFPEIVVPVVVMLRRCLKASNLKPRGLSGKEHGVVKVMLERIEDGARWIEQMRTGVTFAPSIMGEVNEWETEVKENLDDSPLVKYLRVQRKARNKRRDLIDKVKSPSMNRGKALTVILFVLIGARRKRRDSRTGLIVGHDIGLNSLRTTLSAA